MSDDDDEMGDLSQVMGLDDEMDEETGMGGSFGMMGYDWGW